MKGGERYVGVSVARLAVGTEDYPDFSSSHPSPLPMHGHIQVEKSNSTMTPSCHQLRIHCILLRFVPAPVEADAFISRG